MNILVLNAGSSTLKFRHFQVESENRVSVLAKGLIDRLGAPPMDAPDLQAAGISLQTAARAAEQVIQNCLSAGVDAMAHRVVHGGWQLRDPVRIDKAVIAAIEEACDLAPLHNDNALAGIRAAQRLLPHIPSFAVFDTGFHETIPDVAALYALPLEMAQQQHLRRYGFHGISHQYVSERLAELMNRPAAGMRLITCHLGNGASLCAIMDGRSIDTTMGLTPMEGLVMGSRCGDIDPGVVLYLSRKLGLNADAIDTLLNKRSGLLGISGRSADMRDLENAAASGDARCELALEMFAYRVRKYVGAYVVALGGVDAIAFAGGIGEHSAAMRARICRGLGMVGIALDDAANATAAGREASVHRHGSSAQIWVIPTDEELQIVKEAYRLLVGSESKPGDSAH